MIPAVGSIDYGLFDSKTAHTKGRGRERFGKEGSKERDDDEHEAKFRNLVTQLANGGGPEAKSNTGSSGFQLVADCISGQLLGGRMADKYVVRRHNLRLQIWFGPHPLVEALSGQAASGAPTT